MTDEDLSDLPGPVLAELTRLRAERVVFVAEREKLLAQLREADAQAHALVADRDRLVQELAVLPERLREQREQDERVAALERELADLRLQRDALREELGGIRTERDRLRLRLLDAELAARGGERPAASGPAAPAGSRDRLAAAEAQAAFLARELAATKATVSWKVTAPLRAVRRRTR
ncbi:hypothetical protein [Saccharothrix variisporea]|uniref:Uncharacterized protein n=1 Tax=Saccharothrix variisporea TaxID=543527 RepID=A0A495XCU1_9PSEU|nr:hypothetical protein [Saccharothrix variisporea]RKT71469.1 hypothetical protein DFJ66_4759 [Saccharothrix variisporea]